MAESAFRVCHYDMNNLFLVFTLPLVGLSKTLTHQMLEIIVMFANTREQAINNSGHCRTTDLQFHPQTDYSSFRH